MAKGDIIIEELVEDVTENSSQLPVSLPSSVGAIADAVKNGDVKGLGGQIVDMFQNNKLSQCGQLFKTGHMGEKGFLIGTVIEGVFGAEKRQQDNHLKTITFLNNLAVNIEANQKEFRTALIRINDERSAMLQNFLSSMDADLKQARAEMSKEIKDIMDKFFPNEIRELTNNELKALEMFKEMSMAKMKANVEMVKSSREAAINIINANKIDDQMFNNFIKSNEIIMTTLFDTIKELGKGQALVMQTITEAATNLATTIVGVGGRVVENVASGFTEVAVATGKRIMSGPQKALPAADSNPGKNNNAMFGNNNNQNNANNDALAQCQIFAESMIQDIESIPANKKQEFITKLAQALSNQPGFVAIKDKRADRNVALAKIKGDIEKSIPVGISQTLTDLADIVKDNSPQAPQLN